MTGKTLILTSIFGVALARFNQEQIPIPAIQALQAGDPGEAATIAGAAISDVLAASNPCQKLARGDQILAQLGGDPNALAAAIGMVSAEKNFNDFLPDAKPVICSDPNLPANPALRGITPKIDPGVQGAEIANALSAQTVGTPLNADGKSVADLLTENGFTNFATQGSDGVDPQLLAQGGAGNGQAAQQGGQQGGKQGGKQAGQQGGKQAGQQGGKQAGQQGCQQNGQQNDQQNGQQNGEKGGQQGGGQQNPGAGGGNAGVKPSSIAGLNFGKCEPTIKFEAGVNGRKATEFTFLPIDPLVAQGQQEALNPNIITNRVCDQLTNVCEANQAAKDACQAAKTQIAALQVRDKSVADKWNSLLGFAGTVTNPGGGPADVDEVAAGAAKVRRWRA